MRIVRNYALQRPTVTRSADSGGPGVFRGHAAVFNQRTLIGSRQWGFVESVAPGAFSGAINDPDNDTVLLRDHDSSILFARTSAGTLSLSEDAIGLQTEADMPDTTAARDTVVLLDRGDLRGMSFAFSVTHDEWEVLPDDDEYAGMDSRVIRAVDPLYDVSIVTYPAYPQTDAGMRSLDIAMRSLTTGRDLSPEQKRTLIQLVVDTDPLGTAYVQPDSPSSVESDVNEDPDLALADANARSAGLDELLEALEETGLQEARGKIEARLEGLLLARRCLHVEDAERWMAAFTAAHGKVSD